MKTCLTMFYYPLSLYYITTCKDRFILFLYHVYIRTKEYKNIGKQIKDTQVSSRENIGSMCIFFPRLSEKKISVLYLQEDTRTKRILFKIKYHQSFHPCVLALNVYLFMHMKINDK